jgi:hypothetical protein
VRAGLNAKSSATAIVDTLNLLGDKMSMIPVLPIKREKIVAFLSAKNVVKSVVHISYSFSANHGLFISPNT